MNSVENFCAACISMPISLATSVIGSKNPTLKDDYRKRKNIDFIISITVIFILFSYSYYLLILSTCSECQLN